MRLREDGADIESHELHQSNFTHGVVYDLPQDGRILTRPRMGISGWSRTPKRDRNGRSSRAETMMSPGSLMRRAVSMRGEC
jgi:hypothetical protein